MLKKERKKKRKKERKGVLQEDIWAKIKEKRKNEKERYEKGC